MNRINFTNVPQKSYSNRCGKYEDNADILQSMLPACGVHSNRYLACFGTMVRIYADVYNNGWGGNTDMYYRLFKTHVRPTMGLRFGNFKKLYTDGVYLEETMDKVIEAMLKAEDFQFSRKVFILENKIMVSSPESRLGLSSGKSTRAKHVIYFHKPPHANVKVLAFNSMAEIRQFADANKAVLEAL